MTNNDKALDLFNRIIDLIRVCKVETWARNVFDEDVETIRQALTAPIEKVDGWLPIESCPSDDSPIWLYRPNMPEDNVTTKITEELADGEYWRMRIKEGTAYPATHWMPRITPAPPSARLQLQRQGD